MSTLQFPVSRRSFLAGTAATGIIALHPFSARAQAKQAHLRIMETTDMHVNVLPYDYYADKPNDTMGLARTATLIDAVRKEATNSMLVDNGDFLQGNPMGDYIAYEKGMKDGDVHPVIKGMNLLGYECSTLGNHEFNYGLSFLDKVLAGANYPFVCANLIKGTELAANPRDDKLYLKPYVILEKKVKDGAGAELPIKVGIIGFVPPQIMMWDAKNLAGNVLTRDIVQAAKAWVPQMKEEGADIVIALSHSGIDIKPGEMMENASFHLAGVEGIDAVFTGHQHLVFPGPKDFVDLAGVDAEKGTAQRQAGRDGRLLGLAYGPDRPVARAGRRQVESRFGDLRSAADLEARGKGSRRQEDQCHRRHRPELAGSRGGAQGGSRGDAGLCAPAGRQDIRTALFLFALVADDPSVQIVCQAQTWYIKDMLKDTEFKDLPVLSAAAPFKSGGRGGAELLHRCAGRGLGDQERRRPLSLSEHGAGGGDHRRAGQGMAGNVGRHLQPGRGRQGRPAAAQSGFPILQFRCDRRRHLQDRPVAAAEIRAEGAGQESGRQPHQGPDVRWQAD